MICGDSIIPNPLFLRNRLNGEWALRILFEIHVDMHIPERAVRRADSGGLSAALHIAAFIYTYV